MPFGLNHETVSKILTVFSEYREVNQAILYGSRALGTQREESDIDLTLTGKDLDLRILNRIESDLDDLLLPYTFDLSLYRQINNESLINHIERVGIIFYARESNLPSPGNAALRSGSSSAANTEIGDPGEKHQGAAMKKGWQTKRLGDVTTKIGSGATPRGGDESYKSEGISLIRSLNVYDDGFREAKLARIDDKQADDLSNVVVEPHDVLLNITGASVARCCRAPADFLPARVNQHVSIIRPVKEKLDSDYLHYLLISKIYKDRLLNTGEEGGSTRQAITKAQLQEFVVEFPESLPEQQRIVGLLDEAFAGLATAKANAEKNLQNARALFESHLQSVFTQRGPGWKVTTLGEEVDLLAGFAFKSAQYTNNDDDIRLLRGDNIIQGCLRWDDVKRWPAADTEGYERYQLEEGDVVLAMDRPWVKAGLKHSTISANDLPCLLVQRTARLRGGANLNNRFLKLLIGSATFTSHILGVQTGIGVPHISSQQIKDFEFARPPVTEQRRIADNLESLREQTQHLAHLYEQKLAALEALKKSLLHQAFSGEL